VHWGGGAGKVLTEAQLETLLETDPRLRVHVPTAGSRAEVASVLFQQQLQQCKRDEGGSRAAASSSREDGGTMALSDLVKALVSALKECAARMGGDDDTDRRSTGRGHHHPVYGLGLKVKGLGFRVKG
jgi:hypothetical protein